MSALKNDSIPNIMTMRDRMADTGPQQRTIVSAAIDRLRVDLLGATAEEIDRACNIIDSLKLRRLLSQRAELEKRLDELHGDMQAAQRDWAQVQRNIDTMTRRGVEA